jgi:DNA-binding PadR family transcriptional regulator
MTDGNLATHLRSLEEANYITFKKDFIGRKPSTVYKVTEEGKRAFGDHLNELEKFIKGS